MSLASLLSSTGLQCYSDGSSASNNSDFSSGKALNVFYSFFLLLSGTCVCVCVWEFFFLEPPFYNCNSPFAFIVGGHSTIPINEIEYMRVFCTIKQWININIVLQISFLFNSNCVCVLLPLVGYSGAFVIAVAAVKRYCCDNYILPLQFLLGSRAERTNTLPFGKNCAPDLVNEWATSSAKKKHCHSNGMEIEWARQWRTCISTRE